MKIIVLIAGGRTGSDFFQSLLDGHSEISQLPGVFYYDKFWLQIQNEKKIENISKIFIEEHKRFFDSRFNIIERHNILGENKDSFFSVNKELFNQYFIDFMKEKKIDQYNLLCSLNLAYSKASNEDVNKKKIIILHLHHFQRIKLIKELNFEIIYTIRDPLANYTSMVNHWSKYLYLNGKSMTPKIYYHNLYRIFDGLNNLIEHKKKTHVIQLEKLHTENIKVMKDFCSIFNLNYENSMCKSTYHGKLWWGDVISGKYLNGVNPNFKNYIDESLFFKKDIKCIETYLKNFLKKYNYPFRSNGLRFYYFLEYLPFKAELKIWKKTISSFKIRQFFSIFKFCYKKVNLLKKKKYDKFIFPNSIGTK